MNVAITKQEVSRGWVFYDAECAFCVRGATRWGGLFERRGFRWLPLQSPGAAERLGIGGVALRDEMKLLLSDGRIVGGVDAWVVLFRTVWWLWPVGCLLTLPGLHWVGDYAYRWIALHRHRFVGRCEIQGQKPVHHRHGTFFELP